MSYIFKNKSLIIAVIIPFILLVSVLLINIVSHNKNFASDNKIDIEKQLALGEKYLLDMKYEEAILVFNKIIEIDPMNVKAYIGLSDAYIRAGNIEEAIEILEKGIGVLAGDSSLEKELMRAYRLKELKTENWIAIDPQYHDVCEEILELFETHQIDAIPAYMRNNLVLPLRDEKMGESDRTVIYYGDLKDGFLQGKGICIYGKGIKDKTEGYVGKFADGMRSGKGLAIYASRYEQGYYYGEWEIDTVNGSGVQYIDTFGHDEENALPDGLYDRYYKGKTRMGSAEGIWLEGFLDDGKIRVEDNDEENGVVLAGYQYLCVDGNPVPFGKVSQDAWWIGVNGFGIDNDPGNLMAKAYIVYEDGSEKFEEAPHEHAGGVGCKICDDGQTRSFHAWEKSEGKELWMGFSIQ